jgi:hypothetical protein
MQGNNETQIDKYSRKWKERWEQIYDNESEIKSVIFVREFKQKEM